MDAGQIVSEVRNWLESEPDLGVEFNHYSKFIYYGSKVTSDGRQIFGDFEITLIDRGHRKGPRPRFTAVCQVPGSATCVDENHDNPAEAIKRVIAMIHAHRWEGQ